MAIFNGQLNSNEIFAALYNMIISQYVFADNIYRSNSELIDEARVDGSLYGDTKLYYATDALESVPWGNDAEAQNLLRIHRPKEPKCEKITLDVFRMIPLTVDYYLSKRAWGTEDAFNQFTSVMLQWLRNTKICYETKNYNAFIGTHVDTVSKMGVVEVELPKGETVEATNRLEAQTIAQSVADTFTRMKDVTRDFNQFGFMRSYNMDNLKVVWNSKYVNKIRNIDLPTIFHNDKLLEKWEDYVLPEYYFGDVNAEETAGDNATVYSLTEQTIGENHYFAGELIKEGDTAPAGTSYTINDKIICKVIHDDSVPYMSAFETETSFFNPRSLTENHYLIWGHNTLVALGALPFVTLQVK